MKFVDLALDRATRYHRNYKNGTQPRQLAAKRNAVCEL